MRRLWKKLAWVCRERAETVLMLGFAGLIPGFAEVVSAPRNLWHFFAALLCGPFIGSLCLAPSFKEERKMEKQDKIRWHCDYCKEMHDKIRWRDRRLCGMCKLLLAMMLAGSGVIVSGPFWPVAQPYFKTAEGALLTSLLGGFLAVLALVVLVTQRWNYCSFCHDVTMSVASKRIAREAKPRPTKLCEGCWCASILAFLVGVAVVACGPWFISTNTDAYAFAVGGSSLFILMLAPIALRKHCKDCDALKTDDEKKEEVRRALCTLPNEFTPPKGFPGWLVGAGDFIEGPEHKLTTPVDDEAFRLKARKLLADIHLQVSGEQIPALITHEECERRIRAYLEVKKNAQDLLLLGKYAPDVAAAIGCPYTMVRDVLLRAGKRMHLELLNNTLILRSYGYPSHTDADA